MKIDRVDVTVFTWDGIPPTRYNRGAHSVGDSDIALLTLGTDEGLVGHAFIGASINPGHTDGIRLVRFLKPLLMGADVHDRERIHQAMRPLSRHAGYRAIGAVDVALWDIAGKAAGLPVYKLMGAYRESIPAYASSQVFDTPEEFVDQMLDFKSRGWRAYKIHPPQTVAEDIDVCTRLRKAAGDDYPLMLDACWAYGYADALKLGRAIEELGYLWYEDPLRDEDIYNYVKLREKLDIPILATEFPSGGLDTFPIWITQQATDYLRGDIPLKGGLTAMLKIAHLAEAFGMQFEVHHSENSHNNLANLHASLAIANCSYFEVLQPDGAHKFGLLNDLEVDADGLLHAPTGPGIGAHIDFDLVKAKTIAELT